MRSLPVAAVLLVLASSATAQEMPAVQAAWYSCLLRETANYDDGASDVQTIGAALIAACDKQRRAALKWVLDKDGHQGGAPSLEDLLRATEEDSLKAARMVLLRVRAEKSKQRLR